MASLTIVRVATPSETPPHSPTPTGTTWNLCMQHCPQFLRNPPLLHIPLALQLGQAVGTHSSPNSQSCCIIPLVNEMNQSFRVCNSFLSSVALTEKPRILHSKGLELYSSTWHLHCAGGLSPAFEAGVLLLVLRNGKKNHFVIKQISDYTKERNCCAVHAAQEGENLEVNF